MFLLWESDLSLAESRGGGGGGEGGSNIKKVGMLVENFEIDPKGRPIWAWLAHFLMETNLGEFFF